LGKLFQEHISIYIKIIKLTHKYIERNRMFVVITVNAKKRISHLCTQNNVYAITLGLKGGGCAGYQYDWGVADNPISRAETFECYDGKLVIDKKSLLFLMGTEIDYQDDMFGSQFVINNPKVKSSCGCGVSVSFDVSTEPTQSPFQPTW